MTNITTIRKIEFWIILPAFVAYTIRRLFTLAYEFDHQVEFLERQIPASIIWKDLATYSHEINTILPTILGSLFFLVAWYIFHYYAVSEWFRGNLQRAMFYFGIVTILVFASIFFYHYLKLYIRFKHEDYGIVSGFKVYSLFRKLHVLTNSIAGILILFIYEGFAQLFYYTYNHYRKYKHNKHLVLYNLMFTGYVLCVILWASYGTVANLILGASGVISSMVLIFLTIMLHLFYFYIVIPFLSRINFQKSNGFMYILLSIAALVGIGWIVLAVSITYGFGDFREYLNNFILPNLLGLASALGRWYFFVENRELQTKILQKSAELTNLRSQINPHFLFNSLNTLYSVSLKENAEKTADGIQKLGDMMRFMLNENNQDRIPISKEVEYLENYLEIQQMRIDENQDIDIKVNIQTPEREVFVAPMLLNPFVENAFKHGISFRNKSWIFITLTFDEQKLYFKVHNSLHAKNENQPESESHGIGLENVRKRLDLIYPSRYTLDIQESHRDFFISLTLQYW